MRRKTDVIIVGQGLAGTLLAYECIQASLDFKVIDKGHDRASSRVAAGIINPITGRNYALSWHATELVEVALHTYSGLGDLLGKQFWYDTPVSRALFAAEDENTWLSRAGEKEAASFIGEVTDQLPEDEGIQGALSYGEVKQSGRVDLPGLISAMRHYLIETNRLISERMDYSALDIKADEIIYKGLATSHIIFAEGAQVVDNPLFNHIPWEPNKGEVLLCRIKNFNFPYLLRHRIFIAKLFEDLFWCGSAYSNHFDHPYPTTTEGSRLFDQLKKILPQHEITIEDHQAAVRPSIKGRRPVVGHHPDYHNVYILNGLGTKGSSLGPYFAKALMNLIHNGHALEHEVVQWLV